MTATIKRRLLVLVIATIFLGFGLFAPFEQTITATALVEPAHQWSLRHYGSGMVAAEWDVNLTGRDSESIYLQIDQPDVSSIDVQPSIAPGKMVRRDDVIASVRSLRGMSELAMLEASIERETQVRDALASGERDEDIAVEEQRVQLAQVELAGFEREFDRVLALADSNLVSQAEYERAESELQERRAELALDEARLRAARVGARPAEIAAQNAEINRLEAELEGVRRSFGTGQIIRSPLDGIISLKNDPRSILVVQGLDTLAVRVVFPEAFAAYLDPGQTVQVFFPGLPERLIDVQLDQFGFYGGDTTATYGLGLISNGGFELEPGMHGTAELPIGRITLFERIRDVIRSGNQM